MNRPMSIYWPVAMTEDAQRRIAELDRYGLLYHPDTIRTLPPPATLAERIAPIRGRHKETEMKVKKGERTIRTLGVNRLARELGITPAHVSQVLSGKRTSRRVSAAAVGRVQIIEQDKVRTRKEAS